MLRSRSYNVAARTLSIVDVPLRPSNEFISLNQDSLSQETQRISNYIATSQLQVDIRWPRSLRLLGIKDNIATSELPTTCGSGILKQHQSPFEATVVAQLRKVTSVAGKTNLDEFGMGSHSLNSFFGPVLGNFPDQGRSVGGSSGGSAVAVASGQCQFALGTDTGGSVRLPAAYTGMVGFKPSYGLISRWGVVPYANSLDTVGIIAPEARNLNEALNYLRHHDPRDPTSVTTSAWERMRRSTTKKVQSGDFNGKIFCNFKVGVPIEYNIEELDPGIRQTWSDTLTILQENGATIVPISLPNTKHALSAYYVLAPAEAASNLSKYDGVRYGSRESATDGSGNVLYSKTRGDGFGDEVKRRILLGSYTLSSTAIDNYFIKAQKVRRLVQRDFDRVFSTPNPLHPAEQFDLSDMDESILLANKLGPSQVDLIVCPTAPAPPPTIEEISKQSTVDTYMNDIFTVPASLAGLPALSLSCPMPKKYRQPGAPDTAGIQLIGQYGDDFRVIAIANKLEKLLYPFNSRFRKFKFDTVTPSESNTTESRELSVSKTEVKKASKKASIRKVTLPWQVPISKRRRPLRLNRLIRRLPVSAGVEPELIRKHATDKGETEPRDPNTHKEITNQLEETLVVWSSIDLETTSSQLESKVPRKCSLEGENNPKQGESVNGNENFRW